MHLADYMEAHNLSDEEVAASIDCSRPTVSRIRRRQVRPSWKTMEAIKRFTNGASTADDYFELEAAQ